jgi:UDP-3-O-acyl N-acetylglucosamine deacetylase
MDTGRILIVDDEESIVQTLTGILRDEGFEVLWAGDGDQALLLIQTTPPDVVLLDIWLPGQDGIELLQALKETHTDTEVIMMSGHGNIETAVKATKLGASDYLEKPLSLESVLLAVNQALSRRQQLGYHTTSAHVSQQQTHVLRTSARGWQRHVTAYGLQSAALPGQSQQKQRTLRRSVVLYGRGLQSGLKTGIILSPLPPNSGIIFSNITSGETLPASIDFVESTDFCTSLRKGRITARTIEHVMSVLHAYRIANLLIKISDEVPIMDGSAVDFCALVEEGGIVEQDAVAEEFIVDQCYHIGEVKPEAKFILVEPYDGFRVTYRLAYPPPLGVQECAYEYRDGASYCREIAPARTFAFVRDVERMHELGLVAGGRLNNVVLIDDEKIVNSVPLRFPDEFARHKILDIIGDLYLLGQPLRGHVRANMTGHTENAALVQKLRATMALTSIVYRNM